MDKNLLLIFKYAWLRGEAVSKCHSATECLHEIPGKEKCNLWKQAGTLRWALRDPMSIWADTRLAGHGIRESPAARMVISSKDSAPGSFHPISGGGDGS